MSAVALAPGAAGAERLEKGFQVMVAPRLLARGSTVNVYAVVTDPQAREQSSYGYRTVATVVRAGVEGASRRPYSSKGYRCGARLRSQTTTFTCTLDGGGTTMVTLRFAVIYRRDVGR